MNRNEYKKRYRQEHKGHIGKRGKKLPDWYIKRISHWKQRHISLMPNFKTYWEQYAYFYIKADKKCEICGKPLRMWYSNGISPEKYKDMETANLDHNHDTGYPRGILCSNCNYVVGIIEKRLNGNAKFVSNYLNKKFNFN